MCKFPIKEKKLYYIINFAFLYVTIVYECFQRTFVSRNRLKQNSNEETFGWLVTEIEKKTIEIKRRNSLLSFALEIKLPIE